MTNVTNIKDSFHATATRIIVDNLSNRAGKWVSAPFVICLVEDFSNPNTSAQEVIDEMVKSDVLERRFFTIPGKFGSPVKLAEYRLTPKPW